MGVCRSKDDDSKEEDLPNLNVRTNGENRLSTMQDNTITFKMVLIGNKAVGKTR